MKIFEFDSGEIEWIASETKKEAINFYHKLTDIDKKSIKTDYTITELPKEKWSQMTITNTEIDEYNDWETKTVEEFMKDVHNSEYIASTIY